MAYSQHPIYNDPYVDTDCAGPRAMNAEQVSPSHPGQPPLPSDTPPLRDKPPIVGGISKPYPAAPHRPSRSRRHSLPFAFPPLFSQPSNSSSTSLVPAEGRPIPLDDGTAAHRTSALRELNSNFPSPVTRHRYAKSTGAQSSTYSQPVIVRTYSGPSQSNSPSYPYRPSSVTRGGSRRIPLPASSRAGSYLSRGSVKPTISQTGSSRTAPPSAGSRNARVVVNSMPRTRHKKSKLPWQWPLVGEGDQDEPKLPPLEAFSFKSFMADLQNEGGISTDLDRIAEICARSRYSLSNQYEVHVTPHGSGASFVSSPARSRRKGNGSNVGGPTLQAIASDDDEHSVRGHRKRRSGGRRKSVAYGTLETIMSSSRSSEEDKTKKKSAAEIAEEVRGRAARKNSDTGPTSTSGATTSGGSGTRSESQTGGTTSQKGERPGKRVVREKSASLANALLENNKHGAGQNGGTSPRSSASALVSEPARPQTSPSHLEIRTVPGGASADGNAQNSEAPQNAELMDELADMVSRTDEQNSQNYGLLAGWDAWIPWKGTRAPSSHGGQSAKRRGSNAPSHAEGSLRQLLLTVDVKDNKGKAVSRSG